MSPPNIHVNGQLVNNDTSPTSEPLGLTLDLASGLDLNSVVYTSVGSNNITDPSTNFIIESVVEKLGIDNITNIFRQIMESKPHLVKPVIKEILEDKLDSINLSEIINDIITDRIGTIELEEIDKIKIKHATSGKYAYQPGLDGGVIRHRVDWDKSKEYKISQINNSRLYVDWMHNVTATSD